MGRRASQLTVIELISETIEQSGFLEREMSALSLSNLVLPARGAVIEPLNVLLHFFRYLRRRWRLEMHAFMLNQPEDRLHRFDVQFPAAGCDMPMALYNHSVPAKPHLLGKRCRNCVCKLSRIDCIFGS